MCMTLKKYRLSGSAAMTAPCSTEGPGGLRNCSVPGQQPVFGLWAGPARVYQIFWADFPDRLFLGPGLTSPVRGFSRLWPYSKRKPLTRPIQPLRRSNLRLLVSELACQHRFITHLGAELGLMQTHAFIGERCNPQSAPAVAPHRALQPISRQKRHRSLLVTVGARPKVVPEESSIVERLERSLHLPASASPQQIQQSPQESSAGSSSSKRTVDEAEVLHSTTYHRAWVFGATALFSTLLVKGLSGIHTWQGAVGSGVGMVAAYYVSGEQQDSLALPIHDRMVMCNAAMQNHATAVFLS